MVEVDVFWAYGFGASLAAASGRQLAKKEKPFESKYFVQTLLFLALVWAPTGMLLLIRHPSWETMQVADDFYSMSEWLILGFGFTNVTQGILGFWVGLQLMKAGKYYLSQLNWIFGYFGMFFILLYGWDGLGYDRFLYDRDMLAGSPAWTAGAGTADGVLNGLLNFVQSGVFITLLTDGVYLLPVFGWLMLKWYREAMVQNPALNHYSAPTLLASYLGGVFFVGLGVAAVCSVAVAYIGALLGVEDNILRGLGSVPANTSMHVLSYFLGLPLGLYACWILLLRPGMPFYHLLQPLCLSGDESTLSNSNLAQSA